MNATVNVDIKTTFQFELEDVEDEADARRQVEGMLIDYLGPAYSSNGFEETWEVTTS